MARHPISVPVHRGARSGGGPIRPDARKLADLTKKSADSGVNVKLGVGSAGDSLRRSGCSVPVLRIGALILTV
jgi:hypothetical protein